MANVLILSDSQSPFQNPGYIDHAKRLYDKYKIDQVIHIGDLADMKFLKYASINDPHSAAQQHLLALDFLYELYKTFPEVLVCNCNHVVGRVESLAERGVPKFMLRHIKELLECPPGWIWSDQHEIDDVLYEHGHRFGGKYPHIRALESNMQSTVIGHFAALAGVHYLNKGKRNLFAMCVGSMTIDMNDKRMGYGMAYGKKYPNNPVCGHGIVLNGEIAIWEPYFEK